MKKRTWIALSGIVLLLLFTFFSYLIKKGMFRDIDFAFTVKVQEAIDTSPRLRLSCAVGEVMEGSTFFASPEVSVTFIIVITAIMFLQLKKKKWKAFAIPMLFTLLVLAEIFGKTVVHHPAPPFFMIKNPTSVFPKYYINEQFSYPSGHAARAVFIAILLFVTMKQWNNKTVWKKNFILMGVLGVCVGLVCLSRIYLGHHWLSDIIGGILLGMGCAFPIVGIL